MHLLPYYLHVGAHVMNLSHCYQREERNLATFLAAAPDTWVSSAYELDGPQYQLVVSLFIQSLSEWEEHRTTILKRLLVLAHARNSSSSLIKSLSLSSPAEFSVYKPLLMMFSLVDSLHRVLKTTLSVSGSDLPTALLEHVRTNDSTKLPQTPGTSYSATQRGSSSELTKKDIRLKTICEKLMPARTSWLNLGLAFGLDMSELTSIEAEYPHDIRLCLTKMVNKRFEVPNPECPVTWPYICECLRSPIVDRYDVAAKIEKDNSLRH